MKKIEELERCLRTLLADVSVECQLYEMKINESKRIKNIWKILVNNFLKIEKLIEEIKSEKN
jgi:hypothetical protein